MPHDFRDANHLPKRRPDGKPAAPGYLPRQRRGITPGMYGRYPDHDVFANADHWDPLTRKTLTQRVENPPPIHFFTGREAETLTTFCDTVMGQDREPKIPVLNYVDEKMYEADEKGLDGYQHANMPDDRDTWRLVARGLDEEAQRLEGEPFRDSSKEVRERIVGAFARGDLSGGAWDEIDVSLAWSVVMRSVLSSFYGHPWAWNEIGYGGPAYPRGFMRLKAGQKEPWEGEEALDADHVAPEKAGVGHDWDRYKEGARRAAGIAEATRVKDRTAHDRKLYLKRLLKGATGPKDNDSRFLLDLHRRGVPGQEGMRRYRDDDPVDMVIVGCGAGGGTLAQRLARKGWRVVVLDAGPFWDPDKDWVSDEKGSSHIYWNQKRIIGGQNPVQLGKNNSGRGVGGSMVHYAGYCPRFHPSDFCTQTTDGVGVDWPISYWDLKPHYEIVEAELPVAGQDWPWGDPHSYPHAPHPITGASDYIARGAKAFGVETRVGPVGITNGAFGNRPHCIYRGFCLQGCKVNAKGSPLVTHVPDAIAHGAEIRADSTATRIELDAAGRATGVVYVDEEGRERFQRAEAVAVAGYSIETPRLLLNSANGRFPHGLGNDEDQVGRYVMVQGAPQVAGRFPETLRQYKAPPPEVSSEQFYETDPERGFARGFSIQTVGPLPIGWAEHVLADGHWGKAMREYMRDYNHWAVLGALSELLPHPENRVTLAEEMDNSGMPAARMDYSLTKNDKDNIEYAENTMRAIWEHAGAQDILTIDRYAHLVGGCRMGTSPENSVVDSDHKVWSVSNLFLADGSVCPTQGSANPALTIMALASRLAERLGRKSPGVGRDRRRPVGERVS
jgi:choline dehydrogenase-like flavoprotein